jgi:hypothetical protein
VLAVNRALPAAPFRLKGYPSIAVMTAGESPGMLRRIAL